MTFSDSAARIPLPLSKDAIGVLNGGGPAPGIKGVWEGIVTRADELSISTVAIPHGFQGVKDGVADNFQPLQPDDVRGIHRQGGCPFPTSRSSLLVRAQGSINEAEARRLSAENALRVVETCQQAGLKGLIGIGGEDTGSSLYQVYRVCEDRGIDFHVAHAGKTIDGDIWHPDALPTFGLDSAAEHAFDDVQAMVEEVRANPGRVVVVQIMGRSSGELTRCTMKKVLEAELEGVVAFPPELVDDKIPLELFIDIMAAALCKSGSLLQRGGVVLYSEGLLFKCTEESVQHVLADAPIDDHGHIRLKDINFLSLVRDLLRKKLDEYGSWSGSLMSLRLEHGRLRTGRPSEYDQKHTLAIGRALVDYLRDDSGATAWYREGDDSVDLVSFADSCDPDSLRMRSRQMDLGEFLRMFAGDSPYVLPADLNPTDVPNEYLAGHRRFARTFANAAYALAHLAGES